MKRILLLLAATFIFGTGNAQQLWNSVPEARLAHLEKTDRAAIPSKSQTFSLDLNAMKAALQAAPSRENYTTPSTLIMPFPNGNGEIEHFRIYEAAVLHPDLGAKHPNIKSYVGQGIENPASSVRFSTTIFGLHVMMLSPEGTSYVDPYTKDLQNYLVYKRADVKNPRHFFCGVSGEAQFQESSLALDKPLSVAASDGVLRTYRLAMACTVEYAAFHVNAALLNTAPTPQKKEAVLAAMNVTMTRVNGIYERDMAITMQIIPENEDIIFVDADNLDNNDPATLINQIQAVINGAIGSNSYDIGHVVSTSDGGVAALGSVCSNVKAEGVTGTPAPVGDPFDVDYVAHEMGHQFGAEHTFNNNFQRSDDTAVEPGSGSTIMAYAGILPPNVQSNSDDYFHTVSISQMVDFVDGLGGTCATEAPNGNNAPVILFPADYMIPRGTAFVLTAEANDADAGAALTYCWEQVNANGAESTIDETPSPFSTTGPNFRSLAPTASPERYFPSLPNVLAGNLTPIWEVTSSVARTFNFAITVRDNQMPNGGQTARENIFVNVVNGAGPFGVTSQSNNGITWIGNETETITWDVAGTTANGVNTANVNIFLSTDGGLNFDTLLAENTPNDGAENITVPNVGAASCRIMVRAVGNIFYAVNDNAFAIQPVAATDDFGLRAFALYPNPNNGSFSVRFNSDSTDDVTIAVHDIRGREVYNNQYKNTGVFTTDVNLQRIQAGMYLVTVSNGNKKEVKKIIIE
ncbi:zinc-dependent metalloprotease [Flavobacterium litorale]|uniref:T9SS type A sorting domain-containing protein n=1 Tax=Flavobacterium litorale TaxID=2856519 RepID=A0ABX8VDX5_9FLAO|nr:zinc-dependent metalloprotease family protein [Flavobacterium litorale]QYJ69231.1 T9SS type A sorting domain-containing protein [Flavobacterium litorale]